MEEKLKLIIRWSNCITTININRYANIQLPAKTELKQYPEIKIAAKKEFQCKQ